MSSTKVSDYVAEMAVQTLSDVERKLMKSCAQLNILNKRLEEMTTRYTRAREDNFHRFRYNLRLKMAVVEGVRNMYYEYAYIQAEHVADLRRRLFGEEIDIVDGTVAEYVGVS